MSEKESKKSSKTVIAGVVIIVLIIAAGVAYYFIQSPPGTTTQTTVVQTTVVQQGTTAAPLKIAMIMPGRIDDLAWNQASYASFENLLTSYGEGINTCGCWIQNHQEKAQIEADIADLASKGYNLIIGSGFEFQVPVQEVAPQYPNVNFLVIAGWNNSLPNLAIADVRTDQTGYVLGYLAGKMTHTNKIGYIMGARLAELARFEPNFAQGAHDANPMITFTYGPLPGGGNGIQPGGTISVVAVGDFHDLQGAKADAELMAGQGVDVIATMGDGVVLGTIEGAIEKNVTLIGNGVDIADNPPVGAEKLVLGSGSWKWDAVMSQWINDVAQGKRNSKYWASLDNGGLEIELNKNNVPASVQQQVLNIQAQVKSGQIQTNPLGPLMISPDSFITATVLQVTRRLGF
jgi:basic membrane lipoprotein Med (substrate-binding protein (PBP1-ABC) superfamily)